MSVFQNSSDESFLLDDGTAIIRILKPPALPGAGTRPLPGRCVSITTKRLVISVLNRFIKEYSNAKLKTVCEVQ